MKYYTKKLILITHGALIVTNLIIVVALPSDPEDLQSVRHYGRDDVADRDLLRSLLGAVLAFVLYAAGHLPGLRRRPDVHDHFRDIHVDLPGDLQLCAGQIPGHGSVWRLGGHDHRLAGAGNSVLCSGTAAENGSTMPFLKK